MAAGTDRRIKIGVGALVVLALLVGVPIVAVVVPPHLLDTHGLSLDQRLKAENDLRSTLAQVLGGTILVIGLYFTARTWDTNRESQITDRFIRTIDLLGQRTEEKLNARVGAIYALERIDQDSPRDHWTIVEILTTFIRIHTHSASRSSTTAENPPANGLRKPHLQADIQAAATVVVSVQVRTWTLTRLGSRAGD